MPALIPIRFGDFLVERKRIDDAQLLDALAEHWTSGGKIGEAVARKGYLSSDEIERLADEFRYLETVFVDVDQAARESVTQK